jgi:hypothetical protein
VPIHKLVGQAALIQVVHKLSTKGRVYAKISSIMPLPKGMTASKVPAYDRPAFWTERKEQYASELAEHLGKHTNGGGPGLEDVPDPDEDDLPF